MILSVHRFRCYSYTVQQSKSKVYTEKHDVLYDAQIKSWSGFCSAADPPDRARLDVFLRRCQRLGYCSRDTPSLNELFDEADESLFGCILANSNHVLQSYLPERSQSQYNLRQRTHTKELLNKTTELNHRDFLIRMLYKNCY